MIKRNLDIRAKMKESGVTQWMLSEHFSVHENTIAYRLRHEMTDADKRKYLNAIDEIAQEMREDDGK